MLALWARKLGPVALIAASGAYADVAAQAPDTAAGGQAAVRSAATLSLEEAVELARRNNPVWLSARNDVSAADWQVRSAYGELLPSVVASMGGTYQAPGTPTFGLFTAEDVGLGKTPEYYFSSYGVDLSYTVSPSTLFGIGQARANRRAVESRVDAAEFTLVQSVTQQYLSALRARDELRYAREAVKRAEESWELAVARVALGAASPLDSLQAAVELGRAQVQVLQTQAALETEKLELLEQVGVARRDSVVLASEFRVFEPAWAADALLARALENNPTLRAAQAATGAATASVRMARSAYLPSLTLSADWSGFTRQSGDEERLVQQALSQADARMQSCELWNRISAGLSQPLPDRPADCSQYALSENDLAGVLARNNMFPFEFQQQPMRLSLRVSLPIFQGFAREREVESAQAQLDDARHQARAAELRLRTQVASGLQSLESAYRSVQIEARNQELAQLRYELAQERYRLGVAGSQQGNALAAQSPFMELQQAAADVARADQSYLNAVYAFNEALVALEAAVGERLRSAVPAAPPGGPEDAPHKGSR